MAAESILYDLFTDIAQKAFLCTQGFALGNAYFFTWISVSTTENTDLLLGRRPALEILFCPGSKERDSLTAKWVFTSFSLWLLRISALFSPSPATDLFQLNYLWDFLIFCSVHWRFHYFLIKTWSKRLEGNLKNKQTDETNHVVK